MWWCNRAEQDCTAAVALYYICKKCILNSGLCCSFQFLLWNLSWKTVALDAYSSTYFLRNQSFIGHSLCFAYSHWEITSDQNLKLFVPLHNILFNFVIALFGLIYFSILYNSVYPDNVDLWTLNLNSANWNWGWDFYINTWSAIEVFCWTQPNAVILHFSSILD